MTREEAIQRLKANRGAMYFPETIEALDMAIESLSAEPSGDDLIIKGAKGIKDGLYNIKDGKLFKYKANGGTVRTYPIVLSAEPNCQKCAIKELWEETEKEDLVSVVRCKYCRWYDNRYGEVCHNPRYGDGHANYSPPYVDEEYWCKDGERREQCD